MKLDDFIGRLKDLQRDPPRAPIIRGRGGVRTRQTAQSQRIAVERAREQVANEVRARLTR